jgi:two-component sensor histidine kinase
MRDYIRDLATDILETHHRPNIRITRDIGAIDLNIAQSVPVGLILNEAISNALVFAFPDNTSGTIHISMHQHPAGQITLSIADDGIGLPPGFDTDRDSAMGLQLIKTLGDQLEAITLIENRSPLPANGQPATHQVTHSNQHAASPGGLRITIVFQRQESALTALS